MVCQKLVETFVTLVIFGLFLEKTTRLTFVFRVKCHDRIAVNFGTDIHAPLWMKCNNLSALVAFHLRKK